MSMRNPRYVALAHTVAIYEDMRRYLRERYLEGPGNKSELVCEDVLPADRIVPQASFTRVEGELTEEIEELRKELDGFELVENQ